MAENYCQLGGSTLQKFILRRLATNEKSPLFVLASVLEGSKMVSPVEESAGEEVEQGEAVPVATVDVDEGGVLFPSQHGAHCRAARIDNEIF